MRFFNTEGPIRAEDHYSLPPLSRWDLEQVLSLIEQKKYFLLHAPRQTGKMSCQLALMAHLNRDGRYRAVYANLEAAQTAREDVARGMAAICSVLGRSIRLYLNDPRSDEWQRSEGATCAPEDRLSRLLEFWTGLDPRPAVLLLDEVDALVGDTLLSLLRQLRAGYPQRPTAFPQTVVLCGVRDLRDYRIYARSEREVITGGSAFNIKAKSLRLGDFSAEETRTLLLEHTQETGQLFTPEALEQVWTLTQGQPWLVNALAYRACFELPAGRDRTQPITRELIDQAKEQMILERVTHLDQLAHKLQEPRVRRVIEPMLGSAPYHEIAPHLVLMAFLHRVINGGATLEREYAIGSGRMDMCLRYGAVTLGMELKASSDGHPDPLAEVLKQLDAYLAGLGLDSGWLVIFDRRAEQPPIEARTRSEETTSPEGRQIALVRT
ncbi:AAA-like domain-containing protein [Halochromatium salexigens]|uniref:ATP-binding protein n=1 Tax=Halochromatium salexigens TaxID=49447 RepID=A0AAJ0XFR5_HALSE|nr:AAA-like domain-containing protein [Halochromatium salexigens]MBK5929985.1 hypothetical protein [Halochromatium salexigens]